MFNTPMFSTKDIGFKKIVLKEQTPTFIFDLRILRKNFRTFQKLFPIFKIFYSVKTNPLKEIVRQLNKEGSCFDAATVGEIELLIKNSVSPSSVLFTHPIKLPYTIQKALEYGIENYTFDTLEELKLLVKYAPRKRYFLRILPPLKGTFYEYNDKFGASKNDVKQILEFAIHKHIGIYGLSFHVGSQNMSLKPWVEALSFCKTIVNTYHKKMLTLRIINIGSGFPFHYNFDKCITIENIANTINQSVKGFPKDISFWAEPGRIIVADSGVIICTVVKTIKRITNRWVFLDMGVYHGLIEVLESAGKLTYTFKALKNGALTKYNIAGNTLDPDDTLATNVMLPKKLDMGDKIIIHNIGAYTTSFFTNYHAMPKPKTYIIDGNNLCSKV